MKLVQVSERRVVDLEGKFYATAFYFDDNTRETRVQYITPDMPDLVLYGEEAAHLWNWITSKAESAFGREEQKKPTEVMLEIEREEGYWAEYAVAIWPVPLPVLRYCYGRSVETARKQAEAYCKENGLQIVREVNRVGETD